MGGPRFCDQLSGGVMDSYCMWCPLCCPSIHPRCALECLGCIYERQGRMAGSSFPETVQVLVKLWKAQEYRSGIMDVLTQLLKGLGPSSTSAHKDVYKCIKSGLGDKTMAVRSGAAKVRASV